MKITQLGHAGLLIETSDLRILMDPVLVDPHQEGQLAVFPRRSVFWDRLPQFDLLVISHHHLDHFDIATLSRLPRDAPVMIPDTPVLSHALAALGYSTVQCVASGRWIEIGRTRLLPTPSAVAFQEFGLLVNDADGVFWNQVDSVLTTRHVDLVMAQSGGVDLLLATWQPMLETAVQDNRPVLFPTLEYAQLLGNVARVRPKALVPGANGFEYIGEASWLNHVVFPQSRERFLHDATMMLPELAGKVFPFDPGDILELKEGNTTFRHRGSEFVDSHERDPFVLEFSPATAQRSLQVAAEPVGEADHANVLEFLETTLVRYINEHPILFRTHQDWDVVFQLELAYPDESKYFWVNFAETEIKLHSGHSDLANMFCGLTASGLAALLSGKSGWDRTVMGGAFYQHHRVYGVWRNGVILPNGIDAINPLMLVLPEDKAFEKMIEGRIGNVCGRPEAREAHAS